MGSHLCCGARGAVGGSVPCSRAPQSWYWGWRERCTPPTYNSCRTWDSNSQPLGYESNSLTIRPRLPQFGNLPWVCVNKGLSICQTTSAKILNASKCRLGETSFKNMLNTDPKPLNSSIFVSYSKWHLRVQWWQALLSGLSLPSVHPPLETQTQFNSIQISICQCKHNME